MTENAQVAKRHMGLERQRRVSNTVIYVVLVLISVIWLIPFLFILLQSFRVETTMEVGYVLPRQWGLDNYTYLLNPDNCSFLKWYLNTLIIALFVAVFQTVIVLCMSYTLSRFRFKLRTPMMTTSISGLQWKMRYSVEWPPFSFFAVFSKMCAILPDKQIFVHYISLMHKPYMIFAF